MILVVESIILCGIFTLLIVPSVKKNPLAHLFDYPPKIRQRVESLPQYEGKIPTKKNKLSIKISAVILFIAILTTVVYFSTEHGFWNVTIYSFTLWMAVNLFDVFILDWIWFCHSKKLRLPGTEDMVKEYESPEYHIIGGIKGTIIGIAISLVVGGVIQLINII